MKMTYDPEADALYIRLVEGKFECINVPINDDVVFDIGPNNVIVGIEVLNPKETLNLSGISLGANGEQVIHEVNAAA